jgi:ORF6N domain
MDDNLSTRLLPEEALFRKIHRVCDQKVLLDIDLADLYGVETKRLKEAVRRNRTRFPDDFMFEMTREETDNLRTQFASSSWGGSRYAPFAFTEQGVAMLSSVLNSERAIEVNIQIMRVFVKMRQWVTNYADLLQKIESLEREQTQNSQHITDIYELIKELLEPEFRNRQPIGFRSSLQP